MKNEIDETRSFLVQCVDFVSADNHPIFLVSRLGYSPLGEAAKYSGFQLVRHVSSPQR
jgi:hypothetical protein